MGVTVLEAVLVLLVLLVLLAMLLLLVLLMVLVVPVPMVVPIVQVLLMLLMLLMLLVLLLVPLPIPMLGPLAINSLPSLVSRAPPLGPVSALAPAVQSMAEAISPVQAQKTRRLTEHPRRRTARSRR